MVRRCCVNFQCRGVLLIWLIVGQGPLALAVGAVGDVWIFFLSSIFSLFFLPLWETARYRLKYCLKRPLNPKQPTNQRMTTRVITLWRVHVTSLTTSVSTMRFLTEILFILKAIKFHFKGSYEKQNLTLVVISNEINKTRQRRVS